MWEEPHINRNKLPPPARIHSEKRYTMTFTPHITCHLASHESCSSLVFAWSGGSVCVCVWVCHTITLSLSSVVVLRGGCWTSNKLVGSANVVDISCALCASPTHSTVRRAFSVPVRNVSFRQSVKSVFRISANLRLVEVGGLKHYRGARVLRSTLFYCNCGRAACEDVCVWECVARFEFNLQ